MGRKTGPKIECVCKICREVSLRPPSLAARFQTCSRECRGELAHRRAAWDYVLRSIDGPGYCYGPLPPFDDPDRRVWVDGERLILADGVVLEIEHRRNGFTVIGVGQMG